MEEEIKKLDRRVRELEDKGEEKEEKRRREG